MSKIQWLEGREMLRLHPAPPYGYTLGRCESGSMLLVWP